MVKTAKPVTPPTPQNTPSASQSVQIEPLTKKEMKERGTPVPLEKDPEYPAEWKDKAKEIADSVGKGFKYYRKTQHGKTYMLLRKGNNEVWLGTHSEEKEGKLFTFYPNTALPAGYIRPPPWTPQGTAQPRSFLAVAINRVAIIPRDYIPSISVIRYFQLLKDNGFPGDFSQFINDIVTRHFSVCNGVTLPVMFDGVEYKREDDEQIMSEEQIRSGDGEQTPTT